MSVDLQVDYSSVDFLLKNASVVKAIDSIHPDADMDHQDIEKCLEAINRLALFCSQRGESAHKIPKEIKGTIYKDLNIQDVVKKVRLFVFRNEDSVTVYFYPRRLKTQEAEAAAYKKPGSVIKVDIPLNNQARSTFREVSQIVRYVLINNENHDDTLDHLINDFKFRRKFIQNSSIATPYHFVRYTTSDKRYTKFLLFEEKFKSDFQSTGYDFHKKKKEMKAVKETKAEKYTKTVQVFYYLTKALHDLHKQKIFHGGVKLDHFRYREFGKNVVISGTDFSTKLEHRDDTIVCDGKSPLLSGYEGIVDLLNGNAISSPRQGLPADVWALGCSLYKFLKLDYPGFERLVSLAPKLNSMCHRLSQMIELLSVRETFVADFNGFQSDSGFANSGMPGAEPVKPAGAKNRELLFLNAESPEEARKLLEQVKEAWNSTKMSESIAKRIHAINGLRRDTNAALSRIDPKTLGHLSEDKVLVIELEGLIASLCTVVHIDLLKEPILAELNKPFRDPVLFNLYCNVCNKVIALNDRFLHKIRKAERVLSEKEMNQDPLMKLVKKMMHPDPFQRIKTKQALAFLEKKFPEIIKTLKPGKKSSSLISVA